MKAFKEIHVIFGLFILLIILYSAQSFVSFRSRHSFRLGIATNIQIGSTLGEIFDLSYEEPVFRPPAEWRSLILQVTIGCSWNKCTFCEMYQDKKFRAKPVQDIVDELDTIVQNGGAHHVRDVFLADGDAMTLPTGHLEQILDAISTRLPNVRRVSSYCLPRNIRGKSTDSLKRLRSKGLSLVYIGCESGDDAVLSAIQKGETYQTSMEALNKLRDAGIKRSVMILLGLGGKQYSTQHALNSAKLATEAQPEFLSMLTTSFPRGKKRLEEGYLNHSGSMSSFQELSPREILAELELFLDAVNIPHSGKTIFRSDHASNYLVLKGRLGRDRERMLDQVHTVLNAPTEYDVYNLRPEWARGL